MSRYTETGGSYIVYLPPLAVVDVLDLQGHQKSRAQPHVWREYTKGPLGYG